MELLRLLGLRFAVPWINFTEYCKVVYRYYGKAPFRKPDISILRAYLFLNPYRICRQYLESIGFADPFLYGETPLTSLDLIAKECNLQPTDHVFELGSGRGRGCFWLHAFIRCKVVGIELVPTFVEIAEKARNKFALEGVEFRCGDILKADFRNATVLYLYGTSYDDHFINEFIDRLSKMPKGTKIITVSYSLVEYTDKPLFKVVKSFPVKYPWGSADVYLQEIVV